MTETIDWSNEIILRLSGCITHNQLIEYSVVRIGKEYRLDVSIVHTNVLHTILFLITACQLMLLNIALHVVVNIGTNYQSILSLAIHGLRINIIMFARVLNQPTFILELLEVLGSLFIYTRIILRCADGEIDLWFDDMVETHLVITSLCPRLF